MRLNAKICDAVRAKCHELGRPIPPPSRTSYKLAVYYVRQFHDPDFCRDLERPKRAKAEES